MKLLLFILICLVWSLIAHLIMREWLNLHVLLYYLVCGVGGWYIGKYGPRYLQL